MIDTSSLISFVKMNTKMLCCENLLVKSTESQIVMDNSVSTSKNTKDFEAGYYIFLA